jgi:hypothetical protein
MRQLVVAILAPAPEILLHVICLIMTHLILVQPTIIVWGILEVVLGFVIHNVSKETKHAIIHM